MTPLTIHSLKRLAQNLVLVIYIYPYIYANVKAYRSLHTRVFHKRIIEHVSVSSIILVKKVKKLYNRPNMSSTAQRYLRCLITVLYLSFSNQYSIVWE